MTTSRGRPSLTMRPPSRWVRAPRSAPRGTAVLGPALVAAIAYVDPGNISANIQAAALTHYRLLWVVVGSGLIGIGVQYLSAKLGLATSRTLPQLCREHLSTPTSVMLWMQAEVVAMATDVAEFVGAALGLHLLFDVPLPAAGFVVAVLSFGILGLQRKGRRSLERTVAALLVVVVGGFVYDLVCLGQRPGSQIVHGLAPGFGSSTQATALAAAIVGATVMPHAIYLHSELTTDLQARTPSRTVRQSLRDLRIDCAVGLGTAAATNVVMLLVAAALFARVSVTADTVPAVYAALGHAVGGVAAAAFGVALLASGLAASSVGTLAGDIVMTGFLHRRLPLLFRRALTTTPSLIVLCSGASITTALVRSQQVLCLGIPFALVPLVVLTARRSVMGELVNRRATTVAAGLACGLVVVLNVFLLAESFGG